MKNNEYIKNTLILLAGKFTTQFMSFLLVPLYTRCLDTKDYGAVDLIQTYLSLLIPLLILRFDSAVFRFMIDERDKKESRANTIITNTLTVLLSMIILFTGLYIIVINVVKLKYANYIYWNVVVVMISNILLQISRGLGKNKDYSIACIITGLFVSVVNIILLIGLGKGAESILIASIVGNIFCSLYLVLRLRKDFSIGKKYFDKEILKSMLKYSLPMIPNTLSWWVVNVSDRTIISIVWGTALNGIYTVSCKFSNIVNAIFNTFNMSWQESASLHIDDEDKEEYFSTMITELFVLFCYMVFGIMAIMPIVFDFIVGKEYVNAYNYIPVLLIANIFHVLIQLIGGIYIAKKKTKEIMNTTIVSAVINITLNVLFIKKLGLFAASGSTLIAYLIMALYRFKDSQKYVHFSLNSKKIVPISVIGVIVVILFYVKNFTYSVFATIVIAGMFLWQNKKVVANLSKKIRKK